MIELVSKLSTRTSKGILSKAWYKVDGELVLAKGNTAGGYEPYSEVMAYRIAKLLGIDYVVEYWLMDANLFKEVIVHDIKHVCVCRSFLKTDERFEGFADYFANRGVTKDIDWEKAALNTLGKDYVYQLFLLDAIVGNEDRHLNNFGFITGTYGVRPSPIFDMGLSLLAGVNGNRIGVMSGRYRYDKAKPFRTTHKAQVKLFKRCDLNNVSAREALTAISSVLNLLPINRALGIRKFLTWRWDEYVSKINV